MMKYPRLALASALALAAAAAVSSVPSLAWADVAQANSQGLDLTLPALQAQHTSKAGSDFARVAPATETGPVFAQGQPAGTTGPEVLGTRHASKAGSDFTQAQAMPMAGA